uniref:Uncharacterized protein n=1 Tax=Oryza meridionalis TaxID=40149 RepID=A0A0E0EHF0_9ORYZ
MPPGLPSRYSTARIRIPSSGSTNRNLRRPYMAIFLDTHASATAAAAACDSSTHTSNTSTSNSAASTAPAAAVEEEEEA